MIHDYLTIYIYPLVLAGFIIACVGVFEWIKPGGRDAGIRGRLYNIRMYVLVTVLFILLSPVLGKLTSLVPPGGILNVVFFEWNKNTLHYYILATIIYAFIWDFFQYWTHRIQHMLPFLWPVHRVHHSDEAFGASTALRQSVGGTLLGFIFTHVPTMTICGTGLLPAIGASILFGGWGYFNHANISLSLGPLTPLVSGPQWHRLHHGKAREYYDCNFAAFFPVLDLIFGTYKGPKRGEYPETGVDEGPSYKSALQEAFAPIFPLVTELIRKVKVHLAMRSSSNITRKPYSGCSEKHEH